MKSISAVPAVRLTRFAELHPHGFVAILEAVVVLVYLLVGTIAYFLRLSNMVLYGLANFVLTLIVIALLTRLGWWKTVGFKPLRRWGDLLYFLILVPIPLLFLLMSPFPCVPPRSAPAIFVPAFLLLRPCCFFFRSFSLSFLCACGFCCAFFSLHYFVFLKTVSSFSITDPLWWFEECYSQNLAIDLLRLGFHLRLQDDQHRSSLI